MSCDWQLGKHTQKQPLPTLDATSALEFQNSGSQNGADGITTEHAEEEHRYSLGQLALRVPCRQGVNSSGDISSFGKSQHQAHGEESASIFDEYLHSGDKAEEEYLQ